MANSFLKGGKSVETALVKHQNMQYTQGAKQTFIINHIVQNSLQLHCLNSTLGNSELQTWPSYVHNPLWGVGKKPHRQFLISECKAKGTEVKLQDLCEVIKQVIFLKDR